MRRNATESEIASVVTWLTRAGVGVERLQGDARSLLGIARADRMSHSALERLDGVQQIVETSVPYPLTSREANPSGTAVNVKGLSIGGAELVVIGEPCCVRDEEHAFQTASALRRAGASVLQAVATRPPLGSATGAIGHDRLRWLRNAGAAHGLKVACEVGAVTEIGDATRYADILQVSAHNMQNFALLRELGRTATPVLLTRGGSATIEEWLLSAEYLLSGGNADVILCDGGIRTFDGGVNTLDIAAVPLVKVMSHLPVLVDTGRAAPRGACVAPIAKASVAAGAHGVTIHIRSTCVGAGCDARTTVTHGELEHLMSELQAIRRAVQQAGSAV